MCIFKTAPAQVWLSKTIVAMPREGEPTDTLCIWDEKASETKTWKAFGVKGRDNIENLYYGLQHFKKIDKKSQFSQKPLNKFLTSLNQTDVGVLEKRYKIASDIEQPHKMEIIELRLILVDEYPRIGVFLKDETECSIITGILLFSSHIIKLLKWINQYYGLGDTRFKTYEITKDYFFLITLYFLYFNCNVSNNWFEIIINFDAI